MTRKKKMVIGLSILAVFVIVGSSIWYVIDKNSTSTASIASAPVSVTPPKTANPTDQTTDVPTPVPTPTPTPTPAPPATATWPVQLTMAEAASITVDVNKKHKLPDTYVPAGLTSYGGVQLRSEAATAMSNLVNAASISGLNIKMVSGYRSFASQTSVYNNYVAKDGQAAADTYSARPGYSEHQTGLAGDVGDVNNVGCDLEICFGNTEAGKWIAANAQNFGFIIRYPQGKEADTGYQYEPWHLRYLGVSTAQAIYASGKTMDQYYGIAAGGY